LSVIERKLLTKLFETKDVNFINSGVIYPEFFSDIHNKRIFEVIQEYVSNGGFPSEDIIEQRRLSFERVPTDESVGSLIQRFQEEIINRELIREFTNIQDNLQDDPWGSLDQVQSIGLSGVLRQIRREIAPPPLQANTEAVRNAYEIFETHQGVIGYPFPWDRMTRLTGGLANGTLTVIYGLKKSMKTWIALLMASQIMENSNTPILFVSPEMSVEVLQNRFSCLYSRVDYTDFRRGSIQNRQDFYDDLEALEEYQNVYFDRVTNTGLKAIYNFKRQCIQYHVGVAFFDSVHYLGKDWAEITEITRALKNLSLELNIPIVITTQSNRYGANERGQNNSANDIGYSLSFVQDCDLSIRITKIGNQLRIAMPDFREGDTESFMINAYPGYDFSEAIINSDADTL